MLLKGTVTLMRTCKRWLALFLALIELLTLVPAQAAAEPAQTPAAVSGAAELPALNETIVGSFRFQAFNFLGDNAAGIDGTDYTGTFVYSDDFFAPSAIHAVSDRVQNWNVLSPAELALASVSFDLTTAAYASNEGNVLAAGAPSYANTDYTEKYRNARDLLDACGFTDFTAVNYEQAPTNDSIAYVIARKQIRVWDETAGENRDFTLIAVGVRGAGYGAEWAGNVTIGTPGSGADVVRHEGFDGAARTVCAGIRAYLDDHAITGDVKYWVTGYSRAGAVANLTAAYLTDEAAAYHTAQRDVYGYTWEAPQAASTEENALAYTNIHNIVNAMDAVIRVSPSSFRHQRLGVDYVMPYYRNTTAAENAAHYNRMREVLATIAVGANGEPDPLIGITADYPYDKPLPIYQMTASQVISDAVSGTLGTNFGTVPYTDTGTMLGGGTWYIDEYLDNLVDVFMTSHAWDRYYSYNSNSPLVHRTRFIDTYQDDFRTVLGYMMDFAGPAAMGMVNQAIDAISDELKISNALVALAFLNFYNDPNGTYQITLGILNPPWIGSPTWFFKKKKEVLISEAQPVVRRVVHNMVGSFTDPQGITTAQLDASLDKLVEVVIDLYAVELETYGSQYFGTTMHYLWQILCTHEQEVVMSWIKSLDPNFVNRGFRTLTVPVGTDVKLYSFRPEYGEVLSADGAAPLVAEFRAGEQLASLDQRIYMEVRDGSMVIRYPALLNVRADVTALADFADLDFSLADYGPVSAAAGLNDGAAQYAALTRPDFSLLSGADSGAQAINEAAAQTAVPLSTHDTLQILARASASYDNSGPNDGDFYTVAKKVYVNAVAEGQLRREADGSVTYFPYLTTGAEPGVSLTEAEQGFRFTADGAEGHIGSSFTVTLPPVAGWGVTAWYATDASGDRRLSTQTDPCLPDEYETGAAETFVYGAPQTLADTLALSDRVWHVFYDGLTRKILTAVQDPPPIVVPCGTPLDEILARLPATAPIRFTATGIEGEQTGAAAVQWDAAPLAAYDPALEDAQQFTLTGSLAEEYGTAAAEGVSRTVRQQILVTELTVLPPTVSLPGGAYSGTQSLTLSPATEGSEVRWYLTVPGGTGTYEVYDGAPIVLRADTGNASYELHACAVRNGRQSAELVYVYNILHLHEMTETPAAAPTCTEAGNLRYFTCGACGKRYADAAGTTELDDPTLPAAGHSPVTQGERAPTCTKPGYTGDEVCAVCGETLQTGEALEPLGHSPVTQGVRTPTCVESGYTGDQICAVCGETLRSGRTIPALGHDWDEGVVTLEPGAQTPGERLCTCKVCGETKTEVIPATGPFHPFTDVPEGEYFSEPVEWAWENGIAAGTSATTFSPCRPCTRAEVMTFLWRAEGAPEPTGTDFPFTDVSETAFYRKAVQWAWENGIARGMSETEFCPHTACTRAQVVTFLWRLDGAEPQTGDCPFTDVPRAYYYRNAVVWAYARRITNGTSETTFSPNASCTRGQIVTFLYNRSEG